MEAWTTETSRRGVRATVKIRDGAAGRELRSQWHDSGNLIRDGYLARWELQCALEGERAQASLAAAEAVYLARPGKRTKRALDEAKARLRGAQAGAARMRATAGQAGAA